jgi:hypothetical protein
VVDVVEVELVDVVEVELVEVEVELVEFAADESVLEVALAAGSEADIVAKAATTIAAQTPAEMRRGFIDCPPSPPPTELYPSGRCPSSPLRYSSGLAGYRR